jgi:putative holliday junction resolvase
MQLHQTILCFDYGTARIGVASGQTLTRTATALTVLRNTKNGHPDWSRIQALLDEWKPNIVIVGLPLNMDGTPSEMSARAEKFARQLHGRFGVTVDMFDERLSSFEARQGAQHDHANPVDHEAARLILESWLNNLPQPLVD